MFSYKIVYLSDIFEVLNNSDLSFQGPNQTATEFTSKLEALISKLDLWAEDVKSKATKC